MATVTGFTAARMLAIEAASVVGGVINGSGHLILTKHDASTIDTGSVIGPTGAPGVSQAQLDTFMNDHLPIGSSVEYLGTTSPSTKWLLATGQTIVNGQTLYAAFWAIIPASMKSGSSIIMPDMRGKVVVAYDAAQTEFDTIAEIGGSKTHTLIRAELPLETITIDPPSTAVVINDPGHSHVDGVGNPPIASQNFVAGGVYAQVRPGQRTGTDYTGITASVNIVPFQSEALGSGSAHSILQPYITMQRLIKVL